AFDTIHGYRTVFPIPLGTASSFDPQAATDDDTIGARESAAVGLKQIYAPMVDLSHEPRWGRIAEGAGEDPFLGAVMAAARGRAVRARCRRRRPGRRGARAQCGRGLGDDQYPHPRLRRPTAGPGPDHDGAAQRRGTADPAGEVPRRAVRAPVRRPVEGRVRAT